MLKLFRSKRGFTLVEVMVAFVIFAIMAGMVGVLLNTTMQAKQENIDIEDELTRQKEEYYLKNNPSSKQEYNDLVAAGKYQGELALDFKKNGASIGDTKLNFVAADPNKAQDSLELEYYIGSDGNDAWMKTQGDGNKVGGSNTTIFGGLDCGVYGNAMIKYVRLAVEQDPTNANKYYVYVKAEADDDVYQGSGVWKTLSQIHSFMQLRIKFPNTIKSYGTCNKNSGEDDSTGTSSAIEASVPGAGTTIRIAGNGQGSKSIFDCSAGKPSFWVEFDSPLPADQVKDPRLLFGDCGSADLSEIEDFIETDNDALKIHHEETMTGFKSGGSIKLITFIPYVAPDDPTTTDVDESATYVNVFAAKKPAEEEGTE